MQDKTLDKTRIYASEIGQYYFCPIAWYLQRCGYKSHAPTLYHGTRKHQIYGRHLTKKTRQEKYATILFIAGTLGLLFSIVLFILEAYI